jgi:hypothetical protein
MLRGPDTKLAVSCCAVLQQVADIWLVATAWIECAILVDFTCVCVGGGGEGLSSGWALWPLWHAVEVDVGALRPKV